MDCYKYFQNKHWPWKGHSDVKRREGGDREVMVGQKKVKRLVLELVIAGWNPTPMMTFLCENGNIQLMVKRMKECSQQNKPWP